MPAAHLCLSRIPSVWSSGQDQCATIKRQLERLMPGVAIFLDVTAARNQTFLARGSVSREIKSVSLLVDAAGGQPTEH